MFFFSSLPGYFILSLPFLRPYISWNVHDFLYVMWKYQGMFEVLQWKHLLFAIGFNVVLLIPSLQLHNYRNKAINEWK
jgi:ABC-type uncharacterized transport system YnjBCD permease subunit